MAHKVKEGGGVFTEHEANVSLDPRLSSPFNQSGVSLGVSQTDTSKMGGGALPSLTSPSILKQAQSIADAVYGTPKSEPNMALASLLYFSKLAEESSKPGATLLGAAGTAFQSPTAYLLQEKEKERQAKQSKASLVAGLVPTLAKTKTTKDPQFYTLTADTVINGQKKNKGDNIPLTSDEFKLLPDSIKGILGPYEKDNQETFKGYTAIKSFTGTDGINYEEGKTYQLSSDNLKNLGQGKNNFIDYETPKQDTYKTYEVTEPFTVEGITYKVGDQHLFPLSILKEHSGNLKEAKILSEMEKKGEKYKNIFKPISENYKNEDQVKNFIDLNTQFQKVESSYAMAYELDRPQVADLSMIFAYMKMLDPRSVVREGEQQQARQTGGAADYLITTVQSILGGSTLTDKQRRSFYQQARDLLEKKGVDLTRVNAQAQLVATANEIDFDLYKVEPLIPKLVKFRTKPKIEDLKGVDLSVLNDLINGGYTNVLNDDDYIDAINKELERRLAENT
jgi:hypothetical protein